jgi:3,4-dihydroxy 2-butanone 4-phosphate synthase/GTP cyclohydrolase II
MDDPLDGLLRQVAALPVPASRPAITLTYAQTLDGCIATADRRPLSLSSPAAQTLTHQLRASHDAILIGVGTVLTDNPRLTVRLVEGPDPRPIVLDSLARTPPGAQLLRGPQPAWILTGPDAPPRRLRQLEDAGAQTMTIERGTDGRLSLSAVFARLHTAGTRRVMIEGGAAVITSCLRDRLVDLVILTVAPRWEIGLPAMNGDGIRLELEAPRWLVLDTDGIVWGRPAWQAQ